MIIVYFFYFAFGLLLFASLNVIKPMTFLGIQKRSTGREMFLAAIILLIILPVIGPSNFAAVEYAEHLPKWVGYIAFLIVILAVIAIILICVNVILSLWKKLRSFLKFHGN